MFSIYENSITLSSFNCLNDVFYFISYIPMLYEDNRDNANSQNILALVENGLYRFYGIENRQILVGYARYYIPTDDKILRLDNIEIASPKRSNGLGTILLNQSLKNIASDFPYLEQIEVYSLSEDSTRFYIKNGFEVYLGDNCLTKKLIRK